MESVCGSLWMPSGPLGTMVARDGPLVCGCTDAHSPQGPASEPEDELVFSRGPRPCLGLCRAEPSSSWSALHAG